MPGCYIFQKGRPPCLINSVPNAVNWSSKSRSCRSPSSPAASNIDNAEASEVFQRIEVEAWRLLQAFLGVEPRKVRDRVLGLLAAKAPGEAFETMRKARRAAAARAEAA